MVPLKLYFKDGKAKVELALAKGKKSQDRRQAIAKRDADRDIARAIVTLRNTPKAQYRRGQVDCLFSHIG